DTNGNLTPGDIFTSDPQISADGRYVAFESTAANLSTIPDETGTPDVFLYDTWSNRMKMVSVDHGSGSTTGVAAHAPKMSSDAAWILFLSTESFGRPFPSSVPQLFVRDMTAALTWWVTSDLEPMLGSYSN